MGKIAGGCLNAPESHTYAATEPFRLNQCLTEAEDVAWL